MGSKGGSAPAPPDYASLIPMQEAAYNRSFNRMLGSSRVNSVTPYGTTSWIRPGTSGPTSSGPTIPPGTNPTDPNAPDGRKYNQSAPQQYILDPNDNQTLMPNPAYQQWQDQGGQQGQQTTQAARNPTGLDIGDYGDPWTFRQDLSPEQQQLYDQDLRIRGGMGNISEGMLGNVSQAYGQPANFAGLMPGFNPQDPASYQRGQWQGPGYQTNMNSREDAERAIYNRQMRYDQPQMERRRNQTQDRLLAMGANVADERYGNAMGDLYDSENRFFADATDRAILGGGQEATAELGRGLAAENARFGADQGERQFGYNAAQQGQGFRSAEDARALQYALSNIGVNTQDRARLMNELNAFRTGQQVQVPGTPGQFSVPNLQSTDPMAAANMTYQGQLGQYNANQASSDNFMSGLFGLGGAALGSKGFWDWMG